MNPNSLSWIFISSLLVNNFTLMMFLGLCSFFGVSKKIDTALRLGAADTFTLLVTALFTWFLNRFVLTGAPYLRTIAFIVVIASTVQFVEMVVKKVSPVLFRELGIYLPLITTNCAVLGLALFQTARHYNLVQSLVFALGAGLGLTLALVLMASIREESELADLPRIVRGTAIAMIIASGLSMAFMGFAGLFSSGG